MTEQWQELKETITEMRDNGGTGTQQEVCKFLANYMEILEKQMQQPCEDCISREHLINKIGSVDGLEGVENSNLFAKHYMDIVKSAPSVIPTRPTGKWKKYLDEGGFLYCECSNCGYITNEPDNYCPDCGARCGARMTESEGEECR